MIDPLVRDVLCDPRTFRMGDGLYVRCSVWYQFTEEEITAVRTFCFSRLTQEFGR